MTHPISEETDDIPKVDDQYRVTPLRAELASVERKWAAEAKRRRDEVRSGAVSTISSDEVAREVRESLRR